MLAGNVSAVEVGNRQRVTAAAAAVDVFGTAPKVCVFTVCERVSVMDDEPPFGHSDTQTALIVQQQTCRQLVTPFSLSLLFIPFVGTGTERVHRCRR